MLSALPRCEADGLRPDFWQAASKDVEELVKRGSLSCCGCDIPRIKSCPRSWSNTSLEHDGGAPTEPEPPCHPAPRKETHPADIPAEDQHLDSALSKTSSAEEADELPGKRQCLEILTAPRSPRLGKQASKPGSGDEEPPAEVSSSMQPPETGTIVRESLLRPDEGRQQWVEVSQQPLGLSVDLSALPSPANTVLRKDQGCQTDFVIILRPLGADAGNGNQPQTAAPVDISELQLRLEQHSKACMQTASEENLESSSGTVQQSTEEEHEALPQNACSGPLPPQCPCVAFLKYKPLLHPDQVKRNWKKHGASTVCPAASGPPCSGPQPVHFHRPEATFMPQELQHRGDQLGPERPCQRAVPWEEGGWAAPRAHTHYTKNGWCSHSMDTAPKGEILRTPYGLPNAWAGQEPTAVYPALRPVIQTTSLRREHRRKHRRHFVGPAAGAPQGQWGSSSEQTQCSDSSFHLRAAAVPQKGNTSAEVTTASETSGAEAGTRGPKWWPWRKKCPGNVESSPDHGACSQGTDSQEKWTGSNLPRGNARARPAPSSASTRAQEPHGYSSSSSSEHCSAPITRYLCSCHLRQTCGTQGTAAEPNGNSIRSVWDRICCRQQKMSASPQSSTSEHCCHAGYRRGRASVHGACDFQKLQY